MSESAISPETQRRIDLLFPSEQRAVVAATLSSEFPSILSPMKLNAVQQERWHFAVLKLSGGDLERLQDAIRLAKTDWRDLLVAAGFGLVDAHRTWLPQPR